MTPGGGGEKVFGERLYKYFEDPKVFKIFSDEAKSKGLELFSVHAHAPLLLVGRKPYQPEELKGLKLGAAGGLGYRLLGQYFNCSVVPLVALGERYSALQQGMIDGMLGTSKYLSMTYKWVELVPYAMTEPWSAVIHTLEFSSITWNSLSKDLQNLLRDKVIPEVTEFARNEFRENNKRLDADYKNAGGIDYSWKESDIQALHNQYKQIVEAFRKEVNPELIDIALTYQ